MSLNQKMVRPVEILPDPVRFPINCLATAALCVVVVLLASCGEIPQTAAPKGPPSLLAFPAPPDAPRYYFERTLHSSADVVPDEENSAFKRLVTGEGRTGEGLAKPYGVAVHQGRIYVSDSADREVKVFDVPGKRFFKIGEGGKGALKMPLGLAVDGAGNVYVCDGTLQQIKVYDKDGNFLREIGGKKTLARPASVTVDKQGNRVYIVDIGGVKSDEHQVRVFDAHTGKHLLDIGKRGDKDGEFNLPRDASIGPDGLLYVVDGGNFRVEVFQADGKFVRKFGSVGTRGGQFSRPKGISVDASNYVYVADAAFGNFQIFSPKGELMLAVGSRSETDKPASYMLPAGLTVDEDGRVYMVDQFFRKVDIYRPVGLPAEKGYLAGQSEAVKPGTKDAPKAVAK